MNIGQLIDVLSTKDQTKEVDYIVCDKDGLIVAMGLDNDAVDIQKALACFGKRPPSISKVAPCCCVCGTTENVIGYGLEYGYRCKNVDCMVL